MEGYRDGDKMELESLVMGPKAPMAAAKSVNHIVNGVIDQATCGHVKH